MNRDQIKRILIIYRPGTADAADPDVAAALALARNDPELSRWLDEHCARQNALREKFRQIALPVGLKEQIISEYAARAKSASRRETIMGVAAVAAIVLSLAALAIFYLPRQPHRVPNTLANYRSQMMSIAVTGYYMTAMTNFDQIRSYLAQNQAPSDYTLPAGLEKVAVTGCAVQSWQKSRASMICFRTRKTLPSGQPGNLWLFVIDRAAVKGAPLASSPQYAGVNGLMTATWTQDGKLYLLGTKGDERTIQKFL